MIRQIFLGLTLLSILGSAGTAGWVVTGGPLTVQATSPAYIPNETATAHGYSNTSIEPIRINETVQYEGISKRVNVSAYLTVTKKRSPTSAAAVTAVTLPAWKLGGVVTANPLAYIPVEQVLKYATPHLPIGIDSLTKVNETPIQIDGQSETISKYRIVTTNGEEAVLYLARITLDDDFVILIGARPADSNEGSGLISVMSGLEH